MARCLFILGQIWGHWMQKGLNFLNGRIMPHFVALFWKFQVVLEFTKNNLESGDILTDLANHSESEEHFSAWKYEMAFGKYLTEIMFSSHRRQWVVNFETGLPFQVWNNCSFSRFLQISWNNYFETWSKSKKKKNNEIINFKHITFQGLAF